jgi:hypothetical protein
VVSRTRASTVPFLTEFALLRIAEAAVNAADLRISLL